MKLYSKLPAPRERAQYDCPIGRGVEGEVGALLYALVRLTKPRVCIETGTLVGDSAEAIGRALRDNGTGKLDTCDIDPARIGPARERLKDLPVEVHLVAGSDLIDAKYPVDFAFVDSGNEQCRLAELFSLDDSRVSPGGLVCFHDACIGYPNLYPSFAAVRDWPHLVLPSVIGVAVFHRPEA